MKQKAIFLDRDWTINRLFDKNYVCDKEKVVLLPGIKEVLAKLRQDGYLLIVVTNQTGIGAWFYTKHQAEEVNWKIQQLLWFKFNSIYSCYHHPQANCSCRKPNIGLFQQAFEDFEIDVNSSFMIWDKCKDIEAGKKIGLRTILIWNNLQCGQDYSFNDWKEVLKNYEKLFS